MKYFKFLSLIFFQFLPFVLCDFSVSAEVCNRVVAIVNDEIITLYELNNRTRELTGADPGIIKMQDKKIFLESQRKILDHLIDQKVARVKIKELGIKVTEREIDETIEEIKRDNSLTHEEFLASLRKQGSSYELYREKIKNELEGMQLVDFEVKSRIVIREERIREYFDNHKEKFTSVEKVHIATIVLLQDTTSGQKDISTIYKEAEELVSRLRNGEDFGELARKFSKGPGANEGGDIGFLKTSQIDPELMKIIQGMSAGDISPPIIRPSAIQVIKLIERQGEGLKPYNDVRGAIYGELYREEVNKRYSSWVRELRERSYTKIIL